MVRLVSLFPLSDQRQVLLRSPGSKLDSQQGCITGTSIFALFPSNLTYFNPLLLNISLIKEYLLIGAITISSITSTPLSIHIEPHYVPLGVQFPSYNNALNREHVATCIRLGLGHVFSGGLI